MPFPDKRLCVAVISPCTFTFQHGVLGSAALNLDRGCRPDLRGEKDQRHDQHGYSGGDGHPRPLKMVVHVDATSQRACVCAIMHESYALKPMHESYALKPKGRPPQ